MPPPPPSADVAGVPDRLPRCRPFETRPLTLLVRLRPTSASVPPPPPSRRRLHPAPAVLSGRRSAYPQPAGRVQQEPRLAGDDGAARARVPYERLGRRPVGARSPDARRRVAEHVPAARRPAAPPVHVRVVRQLHRRLFRVRRHAAHVQRPQLQPALDGPFRVAQVRDAAVRRVRNATRPLHATGLLPVGRAYGGFGREHRVLPGTTGGSGHATGRRPTGTGPTTRRAREINTRSPDGFDCTGNQSPDRRPCLGRRRIG